MADRSRVQTATRTSAHQRYLAQRYFGALDGVRALSVLAVITWHIPSGSFSWLNGELGVPVFFVLSGFLITTLALREESRRGRLDLRAFFIRRVFRILPLYMFVLVLYGIAVYLVSDDPLKKNAFTRALPYYLGFLPEVPSALEWPVAPFSVAWSLGIEEKFYLLWPIVAFALLAGRTQARLVVAGVLSVGGMAVALAFHDTDGARLLNGYTFILLGCFVALLLHRESSFDKLAFTGLPAVRASAATLLVALALLADAGDGMRYAFGLTAAVVIAGLAVSSSDGPGTVLGWAPLQAIGAISYPLYLTHVLCLTVAVRLLPSTGDSVGFDLTVLFVGGALSIGVAATLHRSVELPVQEHGRRLARRSRRSVLKTS